MMQYQGYAAEVEFDDSVGCLHGRGRQQRCLFDCHL